MIAHIIRTSDLDPSQLEQIEIPSDRYEAMAMVKGIIGGYMEMCLCHIGDEPYYIFCDDNAKVKNKPINYLATSIFDYRDTDCINGDVVLFDADNLLDFNNLY